MKMLLRGLMVVAVAFLCVPAAHGMFISDGSIFNDDFPGSSLDAGKWVDVISIDPATGPGSLTVSGSVLSISTTTNEDRNIWKDPNSPLNYGGETDPAYEIRFKVGDGDLGSATREFTLLVGNPNAKFNLSLWPEGGGDEPETEKFDLNWNGMAEGTGGAETLVTGLDRDTWYKVMAVYDSANSEYDIYLDGAVIATKAELNAGLAERLRSGDTTGDAWMDPFMVDYIRVGALVPEPASLALLGGGGLLLLSRRRRRA